MKLIVISLLLIQAAGGAFASPLEDHASEPSANEISTVSDTTETPPKKKGWCRRAFKPSLYLAFFLAWFPGAKIWHDTTAWFSGDRHIGHGVHFNWNRLFDTFSKEDQALIRQYQNSPSIDLQIQIARRLAFELSGNYELSSMIYHNQAWKLFDPRPARTRQARNFLRSSNYPGPRGICRHKVMIMSTILSELGIPHRIAEGYFSKAGQFHVWIHLLESDLDVDPTLNLDRIEHQQDLRHRGLQQDLVHSPDQFREIFDNVKTYKMHGTFDLREYIILGRE